MTTPPRRELVPQASLPLDPTKISYPKLRVASYIDEW
jgi:hypothetical protein